MVTTVTSILPGMLGQAVLPGPHRFLDQGVAAVPPLAAAWSVCCFLALSLTLSSPAAAVLARLENRPAPFPAEARPPSGTSADYADRDVELEITLNGGDTFRGLLGEESATLKISVERCYASRPAPGPPAKPLALEPVVIAPTGRWPARSPERHTGLGDRSARHAASSSRRLSSYRATFAVLTSS
ncbi:hypothetical protein ACQEU6_21950 [Spirillospora sp. CA-108201]